MTVDHDAQANEPSAPVAGDGTLPEQQQQPAPPAPAATPATALAGRAPKFDPATFTQTQQDLSALRQELGLDKRASVTDIREAIAALREQQAPSPYVDADDLDESNPAAAQRMRELESDLWDTQRIIHGEEFVDAAQETVNEIFAARTPAQRAKALFDFVSKVTVDPDAAPEGGAPAAQPQQQPTPIAGGLEPPVGSQSAPTGGRGNALVSEVSRLLHRQS